MDQEIKVYVLKHPVKAGEYACAEITLHRPKTKDFVAVGRYPIDSAAAVQALISSISGVPETVIGQFDIDDFAMLRTEAVRIFDSYFTTEPYVLNPPPPPAEKAEAETEAGENG
jgi:hypothetical protein